MTVAEIAEILADRFEEPYASFVLTFSAVAVEIVLLYMIIVNGKDLGALETVKGGIISAVIVDMNVLLGIAILIGGLSFKDRCTMKIHLAPIQQFPLRCNLSPTCSWNYQLYRKWR